LKVLLRAYWDRIAGTVLLVAGAVALILGWVGASGTSQTYQQIPLLISGGLAGLALIVVGATVWVSADLRDEWRKLHRIEARLEMLADVPCQAPAEAVIDGPVRSAP
jgi:hypothetical protein